MKSLGTKFILIALFVEIITSALGGKLFYNFLSDQRFNQYQQILSSQSDLIAREVALEKDQAPRFDLSTLELSDRASFQVVDTTGVVYWDSRNPKRERMQITSDHPLFALASHSATQRGLTDFSQKQNEHFFGTYRKVLNQYFVLGAISKDAIQADIMNSLQHFVYLAIFIFGLSLMMIVFFANTTVRPIRLLTEAAQKIADGNFEITLDRPGKDEVGQLSESFSTMIGRIRQLLEAEAQKTRMEEEVSIASEIQQKLLPPADLKNPRFEIQSHYQSASETGGDYWGYIETPAQLTMVIGDVTGHGLPSAMLTAGVRGCFSALSHMYKENQNTSPSPNEILKYANQAVTEIGQGDLQMTLFVATHNFSTRVLKFSNAGHYPGWILRKVNGVYGLETLASKGPRLGEGGMYEPGSTKEITLQADDVIFLYSDGLVDNPNGAGVVLGKDRIKELLIEKMNAGQSLSDLRNSIEFAVFEHLGGVVPEDDITFSLLRIT